MQAKGDTEARPLWVFRTAIYSLSNWYKISVRSILLEAYPAGSTINFLIRANSDSLLRHELRQKQSPVLERGVEWLGIYSGPGEPAYWQKAAWPCAAPGADCSWVADVSSSQLDQYLTESEDDAGRLIEYEKADDSLWVVRLDISQVLDSLLALVSGGRDSNADVLASVARSLAWWGFESHAANMAERSQDLDRKAADAEDYTAAFLAPDPQAMRLLALSLQLEFVDADDLLTAKTPAEAVLRSLESYERKLKRLPVAGSASIWEDMGNICKQIDTSNLSADVKTRVESAAARYTAAAHVAELLVK